MRIREPFSGEGDAVHRQEVRSLLDLDRRTDDADLWAFLANGEGKSGFEFVPNPVEGSRWQQNLRAVAKPIDVCHCRLWCGAPY